MNKTFIHVYGANSILKGEWPKQAVHLATSYPKDGARFSKAYQRGLWDGRERLLNKRTGSFPTGLLKDVREACEENGFEVELIDHRVKPKPGKKGFKLIGKEMTGKYSYQLEACEAAVKVKQGIIKAATNAGKTSIAAAITQYLSLPTLFLVPSVELMNQTRKSFMKDLNLSAEDVGVIGDGKWQPGNKVTVAIVDTLESRLSKKEGMEFMSTIDVLFLDECHGAGSNTYYTVATLCPAYFRFGLSATPLDRTDGADLRLLATTGPVFYNISNKRLVELGVSAKADIIFDKVKRPVLERKTNYQTVYKKGQVENEELLQKMVDWVKTFVEQGMSVLILVEEINHGKKLDDALWNDVDGAFIPHQFIHGSESSSTRAKAIEEFDKREIPVLICSRILDQGVDTNAIDALVLGGSRKSKIKTMQRLGRGLRGERLIVVEFANYCHKYLLEHSLKRLKDYTLEECFPIHTYKEGTDKNELIQRLWDKQGERRAAMREKEQGGG